MNWRDYPHIFSNGNYEALIGDERGKITGINEEFFHIESYREYSDEYGHLLYPEIFECTLIARKIEDMTDEEREQYRFTLYSRPCPQWDEGYETPQVHTNKTLLYLLSIGVYPFDQNSFQDGSVIDINEVNHGK